MFFPVYFIAAGENVYACNNLKLTGYRGLVIFELGKYLHYYIRKPISFSIRVR